MVKKKFVKKVEAIAEEVEVILEIANALGKERFDDMNAMAERITTLSISNMIIKRLELDYIKRGD